MQIFRYLVVFGMITYTLCSCESDKLLEPSRTLSFQEFCDSVSPTFNTHIQPIVANSCAYDPFCHPNYTNYQNLLTRVNNGQLEDRVFTRKDDPVLGMPPNQSTYSQSQKDDLTQEELDIFRCWIDSGAPE